jgi:beta-lactamase class A
MRVFLGFVLISTFIFSGCTRISTDPAAVSSISGSATPTPAPVLHPPEKIDHELEQAIAEIAQSAMGKVGVGALLLETGDAAYLNRSDHFAMQSVYKLPIAMAAAQQVDKGAVRFDSDIVITPADYVRKGFHSPIRNLNPQGTVMRFDDILRYSISESDGSANDVMLNTAGGPEKVQQYLESIGINDIKVADSTKTISMDWETQYRNWATPEASVQLLEKLFDHQAGLSDAATYLIMQSLSDADTGRHRIHHSLPRGATLAHKTGTGGHPSQVPGYWKTHSAINVERTADAPVAKNQKPVPAKRAKSGPAAGDDSDEEQPRSNEVISAVNDIGIVTLPDGRHIILAVYINDSVSVNPDNVIAEIAKAVFDKWTTGQLPQISQYRPR